MSGRSVLQVALSVRPIGAEALVVLLEGGLDRVVLIDSRPFVDYNSRHILEAVNVNCSKLMKRRLQQDKVHITELLQHSACKQLDLQGGLEVVVYDQNSTDPQSLGTDCFLTVLLLKLQRIFPSVHLLAGGFSAFSQLFPGLCEGRSTLLPPCGAANHSFVPITSSGPTCILPHLYLGCQRDVLNQEVMQQNQIVFVLNVSNTCPKPEFIPESNFLRVPVNDSFCDKILPWLEPSLTFIESAKSRHSRVLVHCLAGISRSATVAIAYIMKRMDMSLDEAYRFVKEKRPTISPNFNFLGQLLDFEKKIKRRHAAHTSLRSLLHAEQPQEAPPPGPEAPRGSALSLLEPAVPEERLLAQALGSLALGEGGEDSARLKRSFSLDIKSYGEPAGSSAHRVFVPHGGAADAADFFKAAAAFKESKACQFSPVQEVSEQSTPERSPDKEEVGAAQQQAPPTAANCAHPLQRSGSVEESATSFLLGVSHSQQQRHHHVAMPGGVLKGWHSDMLLAPVSVSSSSLSTTWYFSSDSAHFYSTSAILSGGGLAPYGCGLDAVRRRGRSRTGDRGDSRRSWHEESSFEKQLKRRSCQLERPEGAELVRRASQSSFSGSMEVIQVS